MKHFCSHCNETVSVTVTDISKTGKIRGKDIPFTVRQMKCTVCGEVYEMDSDEQEEQLREAFRSMENLISIAEIEEILEHYRIGKRPLSLLLGWGEGTLTRYLNGDLPTRQYSATLRRIKADPAYYEEILEGNRKAITHQAYTRSKKALEMLGYATSQLTVESICSDKLEEAAGLLLQYEPDMSLEKLQIMLFYLQGFHMTFWKTELFSETCAIEDHYPAYSAVARLFSTGRLHNYYSEDEDNVFTESEKLLVSTLTKWVGSFSTSALKKMILAESPDLEGSLLRINEGDMILQQEPMARYFQRIAEKYCMRSILDIHEYCQDMFRKL